MNKDFWKALLIRVAKTWCQAFVATVGVDYAGRTLADIEWKTALSVATVAGIICFFWNLGAGLPEVSYAESLYALENNPNEDVDDFDDEEYEDGDE